MAWLNTIPKWSGVNGEIRSKAGSGQWEGYASRGYTVEFSHAATVLEAVNAPGLDALEAAWDGSYTFLLCRTRRAIPLGPRHWEVTCEFGGENSALLAPWGRRWGWASSVEPIQVDALGNVIKNPVGDRYEGLTMEWRDPVYQVSRNQSNFDQATLSWFHRSVNSDVFLSWPIGCAHITDIAGEQVPQAGSYYWRATYTIQFRRDGWQKRVLCEGPRYLDGAGLHHYFDPTTLRKGRLGATGLALTDAQPDVVQLVDQFLPRAYVPLGLS